jgi:tripartite ATP-independent transporter DctM subunit
MDPIILGIIGIAAMFLLIILQVPIGISMAVVGVAGFGLLSGFSPAFSLMGTECASAISNPDLAVVPLFLLMGNFAAAGGLSGDVYDLAYSLVGHRKGGLAIATIGGCSFFGAICGSSPATAATFGRVAFPEMIKRNYSPAFATGCIAAGGTLGSLIPPSVIMIIYAVMAEEFIIAMFIAAVIPAAIEIVLYLITIMIYVHFKPSSAPPGPRVPWANRMRTIWKCWGAIIIGVTVIGGIYGGIFTVNEAAAVGVVLSFVFALVRRKLTWDKFWDALIETANTTAMIYVIIIGANIFGYFITISQMSGALINTISQLMVPDFVILIILIIIYLILGSVFDTLAAMLITLPFVLPLIINMGLSPIWWGIMNVVIIETGMISPPIGMNVFVLHGVTRVRLGKIYRGTLPFVFSDFVRIALLIFFPSLALWLPSIMKY